MKRFFIILLIIISPSLVQSETVITSDDFDSGLGINWDEQEATSSNITNVANPSGSGSVQKFVVNYTDDLVASGLRAEIWHNDTADTLNAAVNETYSYSWRTYIPSDWVDESSASHSDIIMQVHGENVGSHIQVLVDTDGGTASRFRVYLEHCVVAGCESSTANATGVWIHNGTGEGIAKGSWTKFRIEIKWSYSSDGWVRYYKNDSLKASYSGITGWTDYTEAGYWKLGIYKWSWNNKTGYGETDTRTIYHDDAVFTDIDNPQRGVHIK